MEEVPASNRIELAVVLRFVDLATDALHEAREEIDALNVFPVPDGDTGTNMYLTVSAARDAIREACTNGADRHAALAALARGALLGARGNSGVIFSEMLGAIARRIDAAPAEERNASVMAHALDDAAVASYAAVGEPREGTMLTIARAAADAALARAAEDPDHTRARDVFVAAAEAAREALARTPEQLQVLRDAGVVDAGGRGVCVILDAAETVLTGRRPMPVPSPLGSRSIPIPTLPPETRDGDLSAEGPSYEVMYLLDADDAAVTGLKQALSGLGDSLVVVGGDGLWNVHVHVDDVGAAVEAGIAVGRPHRIRVTHFAEQIAEKNAPRAPRPTGRQGRAVVAVAAGPGLAELFEGAGAHVVPGGSGRRPSTGQILEAITGCGAQEVVVLPNDGDTVRAAQVAGRTAEADLGLRVAVLPTLAQVQGLAAMAVHEPGRSFDQDVLEMTATARHARQAAVTFAAKRALTMAGWCEPGDVLGAIEGDFVLIGADPGEVAEELLRRLLAGGGELVTLVSGENAGDLAERGAAWVDAEYPHVDVVVYEGGQDRYPLLMSVE